MVENIPLVKDKITIRPAVADDAASLRDIRLEALAHHPVAFAADYSMTEAESTEVWVKLISEYAALKKGVVCIAAVDNQIIGMVGLVREKWPKTHHSAYVWGVYVKQDWRGKGVAAALLETCTSWGELHGLSVIKLGVTTTNTPAIRCYDRCGFQIYGVEPMVIYYEGVFYDEFLMVKFI
ncbi:GNAT family N-acetyltransferase [candidate division KSB1 bacterium]|nr:GNAT family N-acetyltransferase [candidate division KSB1 bacterium]